MVAEFKSGADLDRQFPALALEEKKDVVGHLAEILAEILAAVQRAELPAAADKFGGLTLTRPPGRWSAGSCHCSRASPAIPTPICGWRSCGCSWKSLRRAPCSPAGGKEACGRGLRSSWRMEAWKSALDGVDLQRRSLVHGDLSES